MSDDALRLITSTLTSQQKDAVKRRVDTLRATMRSKPKTMEKTDVRDVFGVNRDVTSVKAPPQQVPPSIMM